jgi:ABC-2 type transport system permease protein
MGNKLSSIKKYLKVYNYLFKFSLIKATTYRFSFFIELVIELSYTFAFLFFFQIIYDNVNEIAGWTYWETMFLLGLNIIISEIFVGFVYVWGLRVLPEKIKDGHIDFTLTKPLNSLFQLSLGEPYFSSIITMIPGIILMTVSWQNLNLTLNLWQAIAGLIILICGIVIGYSLITIISALSFVFTNAQKLADITLEIQDFGSRPHQIYRGLLKGLFFYILPVVFFYSIPASTWLHGLQIQYLFMAIILAAVFLTSTIKLWNRLIKNYTSASS